MTTPRSIWQVAVFVDASAFQANAIANDHHHREATGTFEGLRSQRRPLFTSNLVVAEAHALIGRSLGARTALRWVSDLAVRILYQEEGDHHAVISLLSRYRDKTFSYADAFSFVLMERFGARTAFTFDDDFRQFGFQVLP